MVQAFAHWLRILYAGYIVQTNLHVYIGVSRGRGVGGGVSFDSRILSIYGLGV